jgi:putative spermidine/putrescine transport system substrate-binding protein
MRKYLGFLTLAVFGLMALIAGPRDAVAQNQSDVTLRVACYGGGFTAAQKKYAADILTRRTGIKIEYIDGTARDFLAKMIASKGREAPFDVVYLEQDVQGDAIKAGALDKLDPAIVTNLQYVYDMAKNPQGYGPGMIFYSVGLAYNYEKFKEAGIPEPKSWADLWAPGLAGKVAIPDLSQIMGREFLVAATRLKGGDEHSLKDIEKGIEYIGELQPHSFYTSSATLSAQFEAGEVWAAPWINGRSWALIDKGLPMRFIMPTEGGYGNINTIDMVAGTPHPKEAQLYINQVLDPLAQLGQANETPYGPTNKLLAPVLAAYPDFSKKFPSSPKDLEQLHLVDWGAFKQIYPQVVDLWNRKVVK